MRGRTNRGELDYDSFYNYEVCTVCWGTHNWSELYSYLSFILLRVRVPEGMLVPEGTLSWRWIDSLRVRSNSIMAFSSTFVYSGTSRLFGV